MDDLMQAMCAIGGRAYQRELVAGTGGNFSARLDDGRILCTPTHVCKGLMTPEDLCVVDAEGRRVSGWREPSSEMAMHLQIYAVSPGIRAIVHSHPPFATTFAVLGQTVPTGILPEADVFLGPVPLIEYQTPGTVEMGLALKRYVPAHSAAILQNHGAVTWGPDLESAYLLTETLEAVCRVVWQARRPRGIKPIPFMEQMELAKARERMRAQTR